MEGCLFLGHSVHVHVHVVYKLWAKTLKLAALSHIGEYETVKSP